MIEEAIEMALVGLVGWRGMVGSVLMDRMRAEGDFDADRAGVLLHLQRRRHGPRPQARTRPAAATRYDIDALKRWTSSSPRQGGDYTKAVYPQLRAAGWKGYWIDAASTLRMQDDAIIILDPVNLNVIEDALKRGVNDYIGGNCTVSCMLMGVGALFKADLVEWMTCTTYQAASRRRRAAHARTAHAVWHAAHARCAICCDDPASAILEIDRKVVAKQRALSATTRSPTSACRWAAA